MPLLLLVVLSLSLLSLWEVVGWSVEAVVVVAGFSFSSFLSFRWSLSGLMDDSDDRRLLLFSLFAISVISSIFLFFLCPPMYFRISSHPRSFLFVSSADSHLHSPDCKPPPPELEATPLAFLPRSPPNCLASFSVRVCRHPVVCE